MGFFARKGAASQREHGSQEDQLVELRRRARRRLIGALVIVLIAVVFVPIFLKSDGADEVEQVVQVFPPIVAPDADSTQNALIDQDEDAFSPVEAEDANEDVQGTEDELPSNESEMVEQSAVDLPEIEMQTEAEVADDRDEVADSSQADSATNAETEPSKTESDSQSQSKPEPAKNEPERTDDGSVALALLEGRTPEDTGNNEQGAAQRGSFTVQVAAYSSGDGANNRREQLISAGVNNAFVEEDAGTYRLRVGPFESRQAAEAALTRLRSLGYDDSFIRSQ